MSKKDILKKLETLLQRISPPVPVGGLQIADFSVRYAEIKSGRFVRESLRLEPGVIEGGRVKNAAALTAVLAELRRRVLPDLRKPLSVILSLSMRDVYIQTFSTPQVGNGDFDEAAGLNARMISPISTENAYYGWQRISEKFTASTNTDMIGAFVQKPIVDEFASSIEAAGFGIAAIEFESLSLARGVNRAKLVDGDRPYTIVLIAAEGTSMIVVRKGLPHFHYFHPWSEVQGDDKLISVSKFKEALADELERVVNFFFTHWSGEEMKDVVFITPFFEDEIATLIKQRFSNLSAQFVNPADINVIAGAALRGIIPRPQDTEISLANVTASGAFEKQQLGNFVRIWRNIVVASLSFLLLLFVGANIFLRIEISELLANEGSILTDPSMEEFNLLSEQATEFNVLVDVVLSIKGASVNVAPFLRKMEGVAGEGVKITRLNFNPSNSAILLNGTAPNEGAAVDFKNRLAGISQFYEVDLPLHNIVSFGESVSFSLTFKISSFDFVE